MHHAYMMPDLSAVFYNEEGFVTVRLVVLPFSLRRFRRDCFSVSGNHITGSTVAFPSAKLLSMKEGSNTCTGKSVSCTALSLSEVTHIQSYTIASTTKYPKTTS